MRNTPDNVFLSWKLFTDDGLVDSVRQMLYFNDSVMMDWLIVYDICYILMTL